MREPVSDLLRPLEAGKSDWQSRQTGVTLGSGPVMVAINPSSRPALLIPTPGRKAEILLASRGVAARVGALVDGERFEDWLILTSQAAHFDPLFVKLCDDVLSQLDGLADAVDPVEVTMRVLRRWQELFEEVSSPLLSVERCAGLLAELHVMEELVARIGAGKAMTAWAGPDSGRVDFRFQECGIEVKACLKRDRFVVAVHGLLQLDDKRVGTLYLFAKQFEVVPVGGDALPGCIARLVAGGVPEADLRSELARLGYHVADEDIYAGIRFQTLDERGVEIGEKSPRIVASSFANQKVPESVSGVTYQVDLTDLTEEQGRLEPPEQVFEAIA